MNTPYCKICGKMYGIEVHHIIKRSQCKPLEHCKLNLIGLCEEHHRGTYGVHGKQGHELDKRLRREFRDKLELLFDREHFTKEEIRQTLNISDRACESLCKLIKSNKGVFNREDIIIACMGGKKEI